MTSTEKAVEARRFVVRGRVQAWVSAGLWSARRTSSASAGWVRNNADGSVEVLAQGTRDQLLGLRSRLREGPRAARVDAVEESEAKSVAAISSFRIEEHGRLSPTQDWIPTN